LRRPVPDVDTSAGAGFSTGGVASPAAASGFFLRRPVSDVETSAGPSAGFFGSSAFSAGGVASPAAASGFFLRRPVPDVETSTGAGAGSAGSAFARDARPVAELPSVSSFASAAGFRERRPGSAAGSGSFFAAMSDSVAEAVVSSARLRRPVGAGSGAGSASVLAGSARRRRAPADSPDFAGSDTSAV
jgi:hypothetical protein